MRDQDPRRTARRNVNRKDRFGSNNFCLFCGYACLEALTTVTSRWLETMRVPARVLDRLLEDHHIFGRAQDPDLVVTLCLNCHRKVTEGLMREGVSMHPETNLRKLVALIFRASAVLLEFLARSYRKWATLVDGQDELWHSSSVGNGLRQRELMQSTRGPASLDDSEREGEE